MRQSEAWPSGLVEKVARALYDARSGNWDRHHDKPPSPIYLLMATEEARRVLDAIKDDVVIKRRSGESDTGRDTAAQSVPHQTPLRGQSE